MIPAPHLCSGHDFGLTHLLLCTNPGSCAISRFFSLLSRNHMHCSSALLSQFAAESFDKQCGSRVFSGISLQVDCLWVPPWSLSASPPTWQGVSLVHPIFSLFSPPPSYFLTSASAPLTSFWPKGELGGLPVMGLALGEYKLMPRWIWIYCLLWWFIQVGRCPAPS